MRRGRGITVRCGPKVPDFNEIFTFLTKTIEDEFKILSPGESRTTVLPGDVGMFVCHYAGTWSHDGRTGPIRWRFGLLGNNWQCLVTLVDFFGPGHSAVHDSKDFPANVHGPIDSVNMILKIAGGTWERHGDKVDFYNERFVNKKPIVPKV